MRAAIGLDIGGTKIEGARLHSDGAIVARRRIPTPKNNYEETITSVVDLIRSLESDTVALPVGAGIPGSVSKRTGLIQNANSTWLNGRDLSRDLDAALGRPVQLTNDANCFALSEAVDGAGAGWRIVLGVILGTGAGGGVIVDGAILDGPLGIAGEWGHTALPRPSLGETPGPLCWCGRRGCMEAWVSGPALAADHLRCSETVATAEEIAVAAEGGEGAAQATLDRHADRLARGLAQLVNVVDPDVIVLGGGLSQMAHLYRALPNLIKPHIFADEPIVMVAPPAWGDAGGVRGAAWLALSAEAAQSQP
jgi:fructokinase